MYQYDTFDQTIVRQRAKQFRQQVQRRIDGSLSEEEFKPLRLMNGLYLQLHAYMLRVAIPYGQLRSAQMRQLAYIANKWDKDFGHFTTRQNIQFNWPHLKDVPDILDALADVEMHAIQTSGNCIRNVTADPWAGAAVDEVIDPRPIAELIRQWSTLHPEFSFLPRKFKIAVTGAENDRTAVMFHDIGIKAALKDSSVGYQVSIGGGMGRTPMLGKIIRPWIKHDHLLPYLEAILRVYNQYGRRDNKYKARIKILVHETGVDTLCKQIDQTFEAILPTFEIPDQEQWNKIVSSFAPPVFSDSGNEGIDETLRTSNSQFRNWLNTNVAAHRNPGYCIVNVSLKPPGGVPGDATSKQMYTLADLAETYGHDDLRITHEQNIVLPHVRRSDLYAVWEALTLADLASANLGQVTDIICCPGMDYCSLATARSIPVAQRLSTHFADQAYQQNIGPLQIKISGCINACGHHHAGHIGILGLERKGQESYQITLGGDATQSASIGKIAGPGFSYDEVVPAVEKLIKFYLVSRNPKETFLGAVRRLGIAPFKEALYATD